MSVRSRSVLFLLAAAVLAAVSLTVLYRGARLLNPVSAAARQVIVIFKTIDYRTTPFWGNVRDGVVSAGEDLGMNVSDPRAGVRERRRRARSTSCGRPSARSRMRSSWPRRTTTSSCPWRGRSSARASRSSASTPSSIPTMPMCGSARTATRAARNARRHSCATCKEGDLVAS